MRFLSFEEVKPTFRGKTVAVVGSGPGCVDNKPNYVESFEVVVRVNNYKTDAPQGMRTDVYYSFFGSSIRKTPDELKYNGVKLCMCKCPNSQPLQCEWHVRMGKLEGIDYHYIYRNRANWWFCDTFIPTDEHYLRTFNLLNRHIPTTGFSAILDVLACEPREVYLTGFDFFQSNIHNINEFWKPGNPDDPICHRPDLEAEWLFENKQNYPVMFDRKMGEAMSRIRKL